MTWIGFIPSTTSSDGDITGVTAGTGMTGGGTTGAVTLNLVGGDGITANANDMAITAAQTTITSVLNTSLVIGRDADNDIDFATDNQIIFRVGGSDNVIFKASGEIEATSLDISGDADIDGTMEADAITLGGVTVLAAVDEDNMASDSNTLVPTQQSVKAYVDANAGGSVSGNTFATDLKIGRDADNLIDFTTDNEITFRVSAGDGVVFKASGEIEATKFDGALEGNADTATVATTVTITDNESTDETNAVIFTAGGAKTGGNLGLESDGDLTYNPSSGTLAATVFTGNLTGNVTGSLILDGNTISGVDDSGEFTNDDAHIMTSAAVEDKILGYSYITASSSDTLSNKTIAISQVTELSNLTADEGAQLENIGTTTISAAQWGYLGAASGAITNSDTVDMGDGFVIEDDDGTEVTITENKEVKFIGSGITTNWTDTDNGTDGDPYDLTFTVDAAQTGITSLLATDIKIGEDDQTKIDFETADTINFYAGNEKQLVLTDGALTPGTNAILDLGTDALEFKDGYFDGTLEVDNLTIGGSQGSDGQVLTSTGSGIAWEDATGGSGDMTQFYLEDDDGTEVTINNNKEVKFIGSGITTNFTDTSTGSDGDPFDLTFTIDAAQTGITSVLNASLVVGRDAHNQIDFSTDNEIHFKTNNETPVIKMKASGEIEATKFDGALEGNADTATALATTRALQVTLSETDSSNFDGTAAVTDIGVTGTLAVGNGGTGVTSMTNLKNALDDETWTFANNVTLAGFVLDGNTITGVDDSSEFTDDDAHIMTSAAINDRFAQINADTTGTAAIATTVTITDNENTNEENAVVFTAGGDVDGGNLGLESDGDLTYNPSTGTLSSTIFKGNIDAVDGDFDGTLEADAITVGGTALNTVIAGVTVTNATNSAHVLVTDNESTNEENQITFIEGAGGGGANRGLEADGDLTYNPSTGTVSATIFKGNIDAVDGDFDGTLEADAITVGGTALNTVIAGVTAANATTAAVATTVTITDNESTNENNPIVFVAGGDLDGGNLGLESDGTTHYNPSTGTITATVFKGNIDAVDGDFDGTLEVDNLTIGGAQGTDGQVLTSTGSGVGWEDAAGGVSGNTFATDLKIGRDADNLLDFTVDNEITFRANASDEMVLNGSTLSPHASDGLALGTSSLMWSDLFLASGGVVNFNNGDVTLTHSANTLTIGGGNLDTNRQLNKTSSTHFEAKGDIVYLGGGSTTQGELCYLKSDGEWAAADADATATSGGVLLALALGTDPDADGMLLRGMFTLDHDPGTIADELYVSTTAGDITSTAPSGSGDIVRVVGYCLDSTNGQIWFNPSNDFILLA